MEDLTIWKINGAELELDLGDADTIERYETAMARIKTDMLAEMPTSAGSIRAYCAAFRTMYDGLFGDGAAAQIFDGIPDNIRKYNAVYAKFLAFVSKQAASVRNEMTQMRKKYTPKGGIC